MGSYGIGPGRVMGTIVETMSDDKGIVWPLSVAPFKVHLIVVNSKEGNKAREEAEKLYNKMIASGIEVLFDDRDLRPGEKFADADLMGMPYRVVISDKTLSIGKLEIKERATGKIENLTESELLSKLIK